ncbi:MAG: hypothetical protein EOM67_02860 [Spirochaetia bacterium]|nr:hypothetical protein [Spirochaetia bacterium]
MKKQVVFIVLIVIFTIIGCTGCENEIGESIDLTYDAGTLTSFQWVKEMAKDEIDFLTFSAMPMSGVDSQFTLEVYDTIEMDGETLSGFVDMSDNQIVTVEIEDDEYTMRITSTTEGLLTLTLKDSENNSIYFSANPLEIN